MQHKEQIKNGFKFGGKGQKEQIWDGKSLEDFGLKSGEMEGDVRRSAGDVTGISPRPQIWEIDKFKFYTT